MRRSVVFAAVLVALTGLAVGACSQPEPELSSDSAAAQDDSEGFPSIQALVKQVQSSVGVVTAQGSWRAIVESEFVRLPALNSVEVTCSRSTGVCLEALALLHTSLDADFEFYWGPEPTLRPQTFQYEISEWTDERVFARYQAPVADIEIIIWPQRNEAERIFRETPAGGGSTPLLIHWLLQ